MPISLISINPSKVQNTSHAMPNASELYILMEKKQHAFLQPKTKGDCPIITPSIPIATPAKPVLGFS
jgi:hypothetical protein